MFGQTRIAPDQSEDLLIRTLIDLQIHLRQGFVDPHPSMDAGFPLNGSTVYTPVEPDFV